MANLYSRRVMLKMSAVLGLSAAGACDIVALPGIDPRPDEPRPAPNAGPPSPSQTPLQTPHVQNVIAYEVQYSQTEWRARLTPAEYTILREGGTERRNSHRYTQKSDNGTYHCKGCALPVYVATQKVNLDIGYVFFRHAIPASVLTGIDGTRIEAHCRRCGSHLGHILYVETEILHCINGTALEFTPA